VLSCSVSRPAVRGDVLALEFAGVLRNLWPTRVPGTGDGVSGAHEKVEPSIDTPIPTATALRALDWDTRVVLSSYPRAPAGRWRAYRPRELWVRRGHEHAGGHVARADTVTKLLRCAAKRALAGADLQAFLHLAEDKRAARLLTEPRNICLLRQHKVPFCRHFERRERRDSNPRPPA
jgi:hypothetical protein